ncbi:MAG: hypothetical protein QOK19_1873 [Solirubrobacteraceae bacterium]|jgi:hypothetical protein|nr:hypothetical protein [Solirubrobacteraceae bacterium]
MSRVDELPADQRAALSLLLRQRKTYSEVAGMLAIPERAVHDRAHAALAILAPREARDLDSERRREIGDYLLGQQPVGERLRTGTLLGGSQAENAWARAVASELGALADGALPEIPPLEGGAPAGPDAPERAARPVSPAAGVGGTPAAPGTGATSAASSSRRGGAVLLAVLAVAAIVAIILITTGGSSKKKPGTSGASGTAASSKTGAGPKEEGHFALHAPSGSASKGTVAILTEGGKRAFYIQAEHIPASNHFFYAVWLYNSPTSALPLSKSPPVGTNHRLAGAALLPSNAGSYREILLTRETSTRPKHPGHVVLRGTFKLTG